MVMNDLGMAPREQTKGPSGADDIHCLPQAIQNQHWLIKRGFHTGRGQ